ncbi:hypothetical protein [Citrobacter phage Tr1]|nr:hypothetical protein [Citrobacter phage Tr1]
MLLNEFTLLDLTTYQARRRTYVQDPDSPIANMGNTILYEDFVIESSSLQPISGKTLQALPDGYRSKAQYSFWTRTEVRSIEEGSDQLPDQILIDGKWYSIYAHKDWTRTSFLIHQHCVAILDTQNNTWTYDQEGGNFG